MNLTRLPAALCLLALSTVPASFAATILPSSSLSGLNPGDTYRFVFVTDGTIGGGSSNLSDYNTFVQNAANAANIGTGISLGWKAVLSTNGSPNRARDNAPVTATTKVYLLDGTMVADGGNHPFFSPAEDQDHLAAISLTELGTTITGLVWSGGNSSGTESGSGRLGGGNPVYGDATGTLACRCTNGWARVGNTSGTTALHVYAISDEFTVSQAAVPEPSTYAMVGSAIAGLAFLRRRRSGR